MWEPRDPEPIEIRFHNRDLDASMFYPCSLRCSDPMDGLRKKVPAKMRATAKSRRAMKKASRRKNR